MPLEDRNRGADDGLHVGQRCTNDVVGADAGRDRCLHEGGIVLIDEEDDGTWLLRRDGADAVERIAIGPRHVDDNYVGACTRTASVSGWSGPSRTTITAAPPSPARLRSTAAARSGSASASRIFNRFAGTARDPLPD